MRWLGSALLLLGTYGLLEPCFVQVRRVSLICPSVPTGFRGLKIAQLSDVHYNALIPDSRVLDAVAKIQGEAPDLIVLTGDLISGNPDEVERCARLLSKLHAPMGVFAVPGNDDLKGGGFERLRAAFEKQGVRWLINDAVALERGGEKLYLVGLDDLWFGHPDLGAALKSVPPSAFRVLLTHYPDLADEAARFGIPLVLAGHSHGGQVSLGRPVYLPAGGKKYPRGLQQVEGTSTRVFTTLGLGLAPHPFRIACPPEVAILTLNGPPV